ncbi:MAG TPA: hypothetical protein VN805_13890 [Caulobacteraceae bacterium]|nr:hypothetical protein [Caulobacteraceae bacterium]
MSDRMFFSLAALIAILMIALATVAPQGLGARSPGPFGRPLAQPAPDQAALAHAAAALAGLRTRK